MLHRSMLSRRPARQDLDYQPCATTTQVWARANLRKAQEVPVEIDAVVEIRQQQVAFDGNHGGRHGWGGWMCARKVGGVGWAGEWEGRKRYGATMSPSLYRHSKALLDADGREAARFRAR